MSGPDSAPSNADTPVTIRGEVLSPTRRGGQRDLDGRKVATRFVGVVSRVPRYVRLGWLLMNDPTVSGRGKAALGGGLAYAISPIDPVPGFIPVLGQLDDLAVLLLAVRMAFKSAPTEVAERRLLEAGLSWEILERDLVTIRATAIWVTRLGGALALRAGQGGAVDGSGPTARRLTGGSANGSRQ